MGFNGFHQLEKCQTVHTWAVMGVQGAFSWDGLGVDLAPGVSCCQDLEVNALVHLLKAVDPDGLWWDVRLGSGRCMIELQGQP